MSPERIAASRRATERARAALKPGDRLRIVQCAGVQKTVTMTGWDASFPSWITSATRNDIHAMHIIKVNGVATSFADPPGFVPPAITLRERLEPHLRQLHRRWTHWRATRLPSVSAYMWHPEYPDFSENVDRETRLHASWRGHSMRIALGYSAPSEVPF